MSEELFGGRQTVSVDLFYTVEKTAGGLSRVVVLDDKVAHTMLADAKEKEKVKKLGTKWRLLTWQASNRLIQESTVFNHLKNDSEIDWTKYRDSRLKNCLVEWDVKDAGGLPVPLTEMAVDNLHANIALALLNKYDDAIKLDKDEEQKN